jgi:hypothetical protein
MAPQGSSVDDSDEDLGIGADDGAAPAAADFGALLNDPRFAAMIETIVGQRMAQAGAVAAPGGFSPEYAALLDRIERSLSAKDEQRPGYMKPLTADELASRQEGEASMWRLIDEARTRAKRGGEWPRYLLGDIFHGPSPAGPVLYSAGQEINWTGAPAECFSPLNDSAAEIYVAYKQWVGEIISVDDLLRKAAAEARGGVAIPDTALVRSGAEDIQVIDAPIRDMTPKRILGTSGLEVRGTPTPRGPGVTQAPVGPIYVGDAA